MGGKISTSGKKDEFVNLCVEQIRRTEFELKKLSNGKEFLEYDEMMVGKLQPAVPLIYAILQHNHRCTISSILCLAENLLGDVILQRTALLRIFGTIPDALSNIVNIYSRRHELSTIESDALLEYLMFDAPRNDETQFDRWLLRNVVATQMILHVFSALVFQKAQFFSILHGSSFSQMARKVDGEGPCIVVVKSTNNKIFGCFASAGMNSMLSGVETTETHSYFLFKGFYMGSRYYGDATCFLFEIQPQIRIFSATGVAENYAYLNSQQNSLPNGLGIGGYKSTWPFFIHEEYGKGTTLANISSFEKCHLSGSDSFVISNIEVWRVGEKPSMPANNDCSLIEKSIIDKDVEARAMLEISGHKMQSDGYR
ncbi:hypothetical protein DICVIV_11851 [Dictyocaulus viviparus]|uniref:MTOR-associated protein MEAK7 n=1 Tax=Dictyocaulus viviparus TaxID=29172 RepID=A0A0D8XC30_DICVI|nr:hypothetical protein DICVIV_11851 [Dictyocaulus viviparus]